MSIQIDKLHTTRLGEMRIRRNLSLVADDVVSWCQDAVRECGTDESRVERRGKNWYVDCDGFVLTINAHSHTIITAHPVTSTRE
ncbi:MAG: DUF3781 domain-containing protein [Rhodoglobus sp.]